jgi:uncharacterized RDD family membrane protein YckC
MSPAASRDWRLRLLLARVSAYLLDVLITGGIVLASQGAIWRAGLNPVAADPSPALLHAWIAATISAPVFLYFVATTWLHGATYGQKVVNLRVEPAAGEGRLSLPRVIARYAVVLAPFELNHAAMIHQAWWAFGAVYLLVFLLLGSAMAHPEGRALHDLIAGSRVVRRRGEAA